jgi:hypothetical protein
MPFHQKYEEIYTEVYSKVCRENFIHCWRVDEINRPGSITRDIIDGIVHADLIIADLTSKNPNVFYELGIAHSMGNKTIMTCQKGEDILFDLSSYRILFYEHTIAGCKKLYESLAKAIHEHLRSRQATNNPVQDAISKNVVAYDAKKPLASIIDFEKLSSAMRRFLYDNNIIYASDVYRINFDDLFKAKGIGERAVSDLSRQLIESGFFEHEKFLRKYLKA